MNGYESFKANFKSFPKLLESNSNNDVLCDESFNVINISEREIVSVNVVLTRGFCVQAVILGADTVKQHSSSNLVVQILNVH